MSPTTPPTPRCWSGPLGFRVTVAAIAPAQNYALNAQVLLRDGIDRGHHPAELRRPSARTPSRRPRSARRGPPCWPSPPAPPSRSRSSRPVGPPAARAAGAEHPGQVRGPEHRHALAQAVGRAGHRHGVLRRRRRPRQRSDPGQLPAQRQPGPGRRLHRSVRTERTSSPAHRRRASHRRCRSPAADVRGIRVTFLTADGSFTIKPGTNFPATGLCTGASICLNVSPRAELALGARDPGSGPN